MRTYDVYIIKNTVNNKVYIGQTSQGISLRFSQHMKPSMSKQRGSYKLYNAINKYGKDKFYVEPLETGLTSEEADKLEVYYIKQYDSYYNGYNSTLGADEKIISSIQDIEKLKVMVDNDIGTNEIAKEFNVNPVTIRRTMQSLGLVYPHNCITKEVLLKYKDTHTNTQIGEMFGVSAATITRRFKKYNISRGTGCMNKILPQNQKKGNVNK